MKTTLVRYSLLASMSCTAAGLTNSASAVSPEFRMLSLAMHQETGRNIYLGAIYLETGAPTSMDLLQDSTPKLMEYRVIARRTSIRSLLGSMLLQSEVATGSPPSSATVEFAGQLLSVVQGSLYAGDSLEITQSQEMQVIAYLNGLELVATEDIGIFDYLLMGWISENGPSSTFRSNIIKSDIDGSLLSQYSAHTPSRDRMAVVSSWTAPTSQEFDGSVEQVGAPSESEQQAEVENKVDPGYLLAEVAKTAKIAVGQLPGEGVDTGATTDLQRSFIETELWQTGKIGTQMLAFEQLAFLGTPTGTLRSDEKPSSSDIGSLEVIQSLDITENSIRLAGFNTELMKLVYSKINYPRRAVRRDIQGALELDVTIREDGTLVAVTVAESSGYSILDRAAVAAAQEALGSSSLGAIDPVAVTEYGANGKLVVPVPVAFVLQ